MKLSNSALFALTAPSAAVSWSPGTSLFYSVPRLSLADSFFDSHFDRAIQDQRQIARRMFERAENQRHIAQRTFDRAIQPSAAATTAAATRYELVDNDTTFQLTVDLPGVEEKDIHIELQEDKRRVTIRGERTLATENSRYTSRFAKTVSLDPTVELDKFTATLENGVLTLTAPKNQLQELPPPPPVRTIPIQALQAVEDEPTVQQQDANNDTNEEKAKEPTSSIPVEDVSPSSEDEETMDLDEEN